MPVVVADQGVENYLPLIYIDIIAHVDKESANVLGITGIFQNNNMKLLPCEFWKQTFLDEIQGIRTLD